VLLVCAVALAGCTSSSRAVTAGPTGAPQSPSATSTLSTSPPSSPSPSPSATTNGQTAPPKKLPVTHRGEPYPQRLYAKPQPFGGTVQYPDGVALAVPSITQSVDAQQGPGGMPGKPVTTFALTFRNGSKEPIGLGNVVVTAVYGSDDTRADPVYDGVTIQDFSGTVQPGGTAQARYAFSIPTTDLTDTTIGIDFDGMHTLAIFTGAAR
jgi:hypothetical protein